MQQHIRTFIFSLLCSVIVLLPASSLSQPTEGHKKPNPAVVSLLINAKNAYEQGNVEQSAAFLERALRIEPRHPVLWHNLAGVRLKQEDWKRSANLAAKSNVLAVNNRQLRVRNWVIIALACEGMNDIDCAKEARRRAHSLAATQ